MGMRTSLWLGCLLVLSSFSSALTFQAPIEETEWRLVPSIFECEFSQPIPDFGEGFLSSTGRVLWVCEPRCGWVVCWFCHHSVPH